MKRFGQVLLYLLPIILLACFVYSYFHISGGEIDGVSDIGPDCTVTVRKSLFMWDTTLEQYTLTPEGADALRELLLDGSYTRVLSRVVSSDTHEQYDLRVSFPDRRDPLVITVLWGEYLSAAGRFDGRQLKINAPDFEERLEAILNAPALSVPGIQK